MQHSIYMMAVRAHPRRKRDLSADVTTLGGEDDGVLEIFRSMLAHYKDDARADLLDVTRRRYAEVETIDCRGGWVQASIDVGDWGQAGKVRHVQTGAIEHLHDSNSAATSLVRVLLMAPPRARAAILIVEKVGIRSAGSTIQKALYKSLKGRFPSRVFEIESLVETDAWLEQARLEEMRATYYGWSADRADAGKVRPKGELIAVIKPEGPGWLDILGRLRHRDIKPGQLLGLSDTLGEPDETRIRAVVDGRTKTFTLGRDGTPRITQSISDSDSPPSDSTFRAEALKLGAEHSFRITGEEWKDEYKRGDWSTKRLNAKWGPDDVE